MDLLPKVFRTEGDLTDFDSSRIFDSIVKETRLSEDKAKKITELVVRRIISSGIKFLSGPHIREIVCSILSEEHFEDERKLYTRIGIPLMDYEEILEKGLEEYPKMIMNPEKIHNWASNRISEEYTHLRILTNEESKAHLYGDIHIHKLRYFDLRPLSQIWDPRMILENGSPPLKNYISCCKRNPAKNLREACDHLINWLVLTQNEICGNQGYNHLITFLAPYVKELNELDLNLIIKNFIYEMNYFSAITGRSIAPTTILTHPSVDKSLLKIPVIGPDGKIEGFYEQFYDECLKLFNSFTYNFKEGDDNKNPFQTPKHEVYISEPLLEEYGSVYQKIWDETLTMKTPILLNFDNHGFDHEWVQSQNAYNNQGMLQEVCMNLPRFAYLSKDEEHFIEIIQEKINLSSKILLKKYDIIKRRLKTNHLPLFRSVIKDSNIFNLEDQGLSISFIGLNEAVKFLTNNELHENADAFNIGKRALIEMNNSCKELSKRHKKNFVLSENISKKSPYRFAKLDLKHFPKKAIPQFKGKMHFYTNSAHFREKAEIDVIKQVKNQEIYHQFIINGAIEYISLSELEISNLSLEDFVKKAFLPSNLERIQFFS
ncbi:MAG: anaerobic ribonucleoside-triphosphate reductase [Promethearchaeota archaeon]|jgi:ribonucleoside-triphosphate reductase